MKKALLIYDKSSSYDPSPEKKAEILSDVLEGLFEVTAICTRAMELSELLQYTAVIFASEDPDANLDKETVAALISYTVSGGNLWFVGDAVKTKAHHELHLLLGGRYRNQNSPCLQDFCIEKDHPITAYSQDFKLMEIPYYIDPDPFTDRKVLINYRYAGKLYPAMWCHTYGWGKVVCMAFGSVPSTYIPEVRKIVRRTGEWMLNHI